MNVVDAGVVVELLIGGLDPKQLGEEELVAPHLIDSEVLSALRTLTLRGILNEEQGQLAVAGFRTLTLRRFPADWLHERIWQLRHNLTAYDATYVALAEMLPASSLLTTDARLASAPAVTCEVKVLL